MESPIDKAEVEPAPLERSRSSVEDGVPTSLRSIRFDSSPTWKEPSIPSAAPIAETSFPHPDGISINTIDNESTWESESSERRSVHEFTDYIPRREYDSEDDYYSSRVRIAPYLPTGTPTHKLWEARGHKDETTKISASVSLEPDVLYVVRVFDAKDDDRYQRSMPLAEYQDSRPLMFDHAPAQVVHLPIDDSDTLTEDFRATWNGPIITISRAAHAWFPPPSPRQSRRERIKANTEDFDALSFERVGHSRLTLRSPFLYRRLRYIAGYYPSFFDAGEGNLDIGLSHWSETKNAPQFSEPWCFLFHRYRDIEAYVSSVDSVSVQTEMPDDAAGSISYLEADHSRQLLRFLKPNFDSDIVPLMTQLENGNAQIPFNMLWYFFEPGTDVYVPSGNSFQAMVVSSVKDNREEEETLKPRVPLDHSIAQPELKWWMLNLWYLDMSGSKVGRVMTSIQLNSYPGTKSITSLTVCPTSIWDKHDGGSRRTQIMDRSKLLLKTLKEGHLLTNYNGPVKGPPGYYSGAVVLDPERGVATSKISPPPLGEVQDSCDSEKYQDYDDINIQTACATVHADLDDNEGEVTYERRVRFSDADSLDGLSNWSNMRRSTGTRLRILQAEAKPNESLKEDRTRQSLTEHKLLLLNNTTFGFALKAKAWLMVYADYASEVVRSEDSFQHLVLDESELTTIKALSTRQYSQREAWAADFIEGKGTGQIILLHGPPGVGKTYTVEAIAEYLGRPLLALTVADIGTVETRVEQELLKWFVLAESWDAVLLVDEADIFLERRQNRDLARNGLVSAFLRRMEYFQGLLFLTTNRVGQIDDAFISRVHVAIGYASLSPESRTKIWQGFFHKLAKERKGRIQITPKAKQWVLEKAASGEAQLNGRDIRNALQTAITLAEAEYNEDEDFDPDKTTVVVEQSHFARVLDITNKFHLYVQSIRREDERKRAAARMDRNDYWVNQELR